MASTEAGLDRGVESFGYRQELKRSLSQFDLLVYGLIFIVPLAPLGPFGYVFNASQGMVPLIYAVGVVAMLFTAISYVTMSRAFPVAGSVYAYAGLGVHPAAGFLAGWAMLLDYLLLPTLVYILSATAMITLAPTVPKQVWVVIFLTFNTVVNLQGIEATAQLNKLLLVLQLGLLVVFAVLVGVGLQHGVAGAHLSLAPFWDPAKVSPQLVFGALSLAALSFLGFDAISTLSEEAKGGHRAVGAATLMSLLIAGALFVFETYLACLFVLNRASFPAGDATTNAFLTIALMIGGAPFRFAVVLIGSIMGALAGALAAQAATSRLLYSMARDGKLPRILAHVDTRRQSPQRAILLVAGVSLVLSLTMLDRLELLISLVNFGALFGFLALHLSVVVHFIARQHSRRWVLHLVVPLIGFAIIAYVLVNADILAKIAGSVWLAIGVVALGVLKLKGRSLTLPNA